jgi:release factor glutamine methyltransferase
MKADALPDSIHHLLIQDATKLAATQALEAGTARNEVQSLLQNVLGVTRAWLLAHPERCLDRQEQARYNELFGRRINGKPLAYILGEREFYGLRFKVTPATLIPRPETELLVDLALQRIPPPQPAFPQADVGIREAGRRCDFRVLDLGTGCGAIALSIAHARPDVEVVAVDASVAALVVACENAEYLLPALPSRNRKQGQEIHAANSRLLQSNWFEKLAAQRFDLIVSNPPYVAIGDPHLQQGDLRFEPASALVSGDSGLKDIRHIISNAPAHLRPGGWLMIEHGYDQAEAVRRLLQVAGLIELFSACDLAGIERVSGGRLA